MALTYSWPGPTGLATTTDGRKALAGLIVKSTAGVARSGVFFASTVDIVTARSDMNVDIAPFAGAAVQFGGPILLTNDGTAQLPSVLVSPGSGTNYYVVYAKQNENAAGGTDANTNRVLGTVLSTTSFAAARSTGTRMDGSGTGLPTGALELATVQMPTGKTATNQVGVTITHTAQYTAAAGGSVPFSTQAQLLAWNPGATAGRQRASVFADPSSSKNGDYVWTGTAWIASNAIGRSFSGAALVGTAWDGVSPLIHKAGIALVDTVASGDGNIPYGTAFPNGVLHAVVARRDFTNYGSTSEILNVTQSLSQLNFRIYNAAGTALASVTNVPYTYTAIGW